MSERRWWLKRTYCTSSAALRRMYCTAVSCVCSVMCKDLYRETACSGNRTSYGGSNLHTHSITYLPRFPQPSCWFNSFFCSSSIATYSQLTAAASPEERHYKRNRSLPDLVKGTVTSRSAKCAVLPYSFSCSLDSNRNCGSSSSNFTSKSSSINTSVGNNSATNSNKNNLDSEGN
jgi:hypothetical protein